MNTTLKFFGLIILCFISCEKDDASENHESGILPKKVIYVYDDMVLEYKFSYDKNKIVEATYQDDGKTIYTYSGNFIVKTENYKKNILTFAEEFTYENDKLKSSLFLDYADDYSISKSIYKRKTVFTYNIDGTILAENYRIDNETNIETKLPDKTISTLKNGNITKVESFVSYTSFNGYQSVTTSYKNTELYEYDNKKNPFANILGYNTFTIGGAGYYINNIIKRTSFTQNMDEKRVLGVAYNQSINNFEIVYNSKNFPTEIKFTETSDGKTNNVRYQYFY